MKGDSSTTPRSVEYSHPGWHGQTKKLNKGVICKRCKALFDQKATNAKYCGERCRIAAQNERAKKRVKSTK